MPTIDFGPMLQPFPLNFPGTELFDYNRRLIWTLSPGFTTLWVEDHLQLGEMATHECMTTLSYFADNFLSSVWGRWCCASRTAIVFTS